MWSSKQSRKTKTRLHHIEKGFLGVQQPELEKSIENAKSLSEGPSKSTSAYPSQRTGMRWVSAPVASAALLLSMRVRALPPRRWNRLSSRKTKKKIAKKLDRLLLTEAVSQTSSKKISFSHLAAARCRGRCLSWRAVFVKFGTQSIPDPDTGN